MLAVHYHYVEKLIIMEMVSDIWFQTKESAF